jgi:hypothetical protein
MRDWSAQTSPSGKACCWRSKPGMCIGGDCGQHLSNRHVELHGHIHAGNTAREAARMQVVPVLLNKQC